MMLWKHTWEVFLPMLGAGHFVQNLHKRHRFALRAEPPVQLELTGSAQELGNLF